jgi:hypothetical protein
MSRKINMLAAFAVLAAACSEQAAITPPPDPSSPESGDQRSAVSRGGAPTERLARLVAQALADSQFRSYLRAELSGSPYREHKLHFQRLLAPGGGGRAPALAGIALANGVAQAEVVREAAAAPALEIYVPVPAHWDAWTGDANVLVATAISDGEAPVAFDPRGRRFVLSPDQPPDTPVLAMVPVETNFDVLPLRQECFEDCGGGGGGGGSTPAPPAPAVYMTRSHFVEEFEGWLKGNPEFEVHILGQLGQTDSLTDYQCAGGVAGGPYRFDQNGRDWSGNVLLFSGAQLANYNATHPGQNVRVFVVEDDDEPCVIRADKDVVNNLLKELDAAYNGLTAGNDSTNSLGKWFKRAAAFQNLWSVIASFIKSNDELIGNAVEDPVVEQHYPGFNWFVKGKDNITNGWVQLEMR